MSSQRLQQLASILSLLGTHRLPIAEETYSEKDITGITQDNPGVVTATAHGFSNGDQVYLDQIVGMTELNGVTATVANKTDDTFELSGINTSGYTAYSSGGKAVKGRLKYTDLETLLTTFRGIDVKEYTATGATVWNKPTGALLSFVYLLPGGAGGASGVRANSNRAGGGGGGGGVPCVFFVNCDGLGSTETVNVGSGGAGGAAVTTDTTNGNAGSNGNPTTFSNWTTATPNGGGAGTTGGGAGTGGTGTTGHLLGYIVAAACSGGTCNANGVGGQGGSRPSAAEPYVGSGGGGAGGGPGGTTTDRNGGAGGAHSIANHTTAPTAAAGGTSGSIHGGDGFNASGGHDYFLIAGGGGGGFGDAAGGPGGDGGDGGYPGGGGGGGGGSGNGQTSGAGGNGANGYAVIITFCIPSF